MNRWLLALGVAVLVLVVGLYIKMTGGPDKTERPAVEPDNVEAASAVRDAPQAGKVATSTRRDAPEPVAKDAKGEKDDPDEPLPKYEPKSDDYNQTVDTLIPNKFRAFGALKCDESGLDPDGAVRVSYKIRVREGVVSATNIKAIGERGADKLARCIEDSLQNAEFTLPRMPDYEEDTELFIRVKSLRKYRSRTEFDE